MKRRQATVLLAIGIATVASGCTSDSGDPTALESPSAAGSQAAFSMAPAKEWTVDTSGWWVPDDPTGCLDETTTCTMSAWLYRQYGGSDIAANILTHGDTISLYCKAPTPAAIRNPIKTESGYWYYADYEGTNYWIPDVYVSKEDVAGMAAGVPDCPSNTPGINGSGANPTAS